MKLEGLEVPRRRRERELLRQQEVPGVAGLHVHHLAALAIPARIAGSDRRAVREAVGIAATVGEGRVPERLALGDGRLVGRKFLDRLPVLASDRVDGIAAVLELVLGDVREALFEIGLEGGLFLGGRGGERSNGEHRADQDGGEHEG